MKIFLATILLLISFYIVKVDLFEGTIPLAYYPAVEECLEALDYISVEIVEGDTMHSLFSMYPATESISSTERLSDFYILNPHLLKQSFIVGEHVLLPIYSTSAQCKN